MSRKSVLGLMALTAFVGSFLFWQNRPKSTSTQLSSAAPIVLFSLPAELTEKAQTGKSIFDANCASCHGRNAARKKGIGPPLVHKIYEPSHHSNESFQRAAALGVRAHHWSFGNMPPVKGLDRAKVADIITYIRELQRATGIF